MESTLTKIDAATNQLDWAIRLFLDSNAFVPAITLAGAAEEIIGEILGDASVFSQVKTVLCTKLNMPSAIVSQRHMNKAKNWLKHWKDLKDDETINLDLEGEAIQYIVRALTNLVLHDRSLPSEGPRFFKWLSTKHPELYVS